MPELQLDGHLDLQAIEDDIRTCLSAGKAQGLLLMPYAFHTQWDFTCQQWSHTSQARVGCLVDMVLLHRQYPTTLVAAHDCQLTALEEAWGRSTLWLRALVRAFDGSEHYSGLHPDAWRLGARFREEWARGDWRP